MQVITEPSGRRRVESGSPWEPVMGYSRAVRTGPLVCVAGCVGLDEDGTIPEGLDAQTRCALARIEAALAAVDATMNDLVRVRIYTTCIDRWKEIAAVMGPAMDGIRPANALVEVAKLVDGALVEIEADAWVDRD